MIRRNIADQLLEALQDSPVVLLNGARQTGKSTLVQWLTGNGHPARYITFDDSTALAAASEDPAGFLSGLDGPVILDEVQRVPSLFPALKVEVDRCRTPGRFLLTGSADVLLLPGLSESLAGRMELHTLWPFSAGEMKRHKEPFIDRLFSDEPLPSLRRSGSREEVFTLAQTGGFPEAVARTAPRRRDAWLGSYLTTILQRDIRDLAQIEHLTTMPRLLSLLASRSSALLNYSELSRTLGFPKSTLTRYMSLLETAFLIQFVHAWSTNLGKRLVKSPKLLLTDTGLMTHLLGLGQAEMKPEHPMTGPLIENFVAMELRKQATWCEVPVQLYHFRAQNGQEVDLLLEDATGRVVGIEVKTTASAAAKDFRHLRYLAELLGERFLRGVVLYTGEETVSFASNMLAMPLTALWDM